MNKQTVYIPSTSEECFEQDYIQNIDGDFYLKQEAYVLTPEELKEIIKKAVDDTIDAYHYYTESPHNPPPMNGNDYFENLLNKENMKIAEKLLREKYNLKGNKGELRIDQLVTILNDFGKQLLEDYTNRIVENAQVDVEETYAGSLGNENGELYDKVYVVDKESITSQLPKYLKEIGI